jgi:hypothetical protein
MLLIYQQIGDWSLRTRAPNKKALGVLLPSAFEILVGTTGFEPATL